MALPRGLISPVRLLLKEVLRGVRALPRSSSSA